MSLYNLLEDAAFEAASSVSATEGMPAGHNGPYQHDETGVRSTAHWLVTFSRLYQRTGWAAFKRAADKCIQYLCSDVARPHGATFYHRTNESKDHCNGLIGQAWTIEALAEAAAVFDAPALSALATQVFLQHPQESETGLWKRIEVDGRTLPFDATFNHQLWFAAAGGLLAPHSNRQTLVDSAVKTFLDELHQNIRLYDSGLIFHPLQPQYSIPRYFRLVGSDERFRIAITFALNSVPIPRRRHHLRKKSIGYHAFNIYAFALLKQQYPSHPFWNTETCVRAINYLGKKSFIERVWTNEYGPQYNPVGFEAAFAMQVFDIGSAADRVQFVSRQFERHYDPETRRMERNTPDGTTLTARLYEATRLDDMQLTVGDAGI